MSILGEIKKETVDLYWEHLMHKGYLLNCSSCDREWRKIKAHATVNRNDGGWQENQRLDNHLLNRGDNS